MDNTKNQELTYFTCLKCNHINAFKKEEFDKIDNEKIKCAHCHFIGGKINYSIIDKPKEVSFEHKKAETKYNVAYLLNIADTKKYNLNIGRNLIGRSSSRHFANIAIDTGSDKTMSREHAIIEVVESKEGVYSFMVTNYKNKNATYINNKQLRNDNVIELFNNDVIKMAKIELKIIISV